MKTYGDLLTALIAHYEKCIEELPKNEIEREDFLHENVVASGICLCSIEKYDVNLYLTIFMIELTGNEIVLCSYPKNKPFNKAKELLQIRIDRMKELFPKWENVEL